MLNCCNDFSWSGYCYYLFCTTLRYPHRPNMERTSSSLPYYCTVQSGLLSLGTELKCTVQYSEHRVHSTAVRTVKVKQCSILLYSRNERMKLLLSWVSRKRKHRWESTEAQQQEHLSKLIFPKS